MNNNQIRGKQMKLFDQNDPISRRQFFQKLNIFLSAIAGLVLALPVIGFLISPLLRKVGRDWRDVGNLEQFKIGTTVEVSFQDASPLPWSGITAKTAAWLRRVDETNFIAFSINCTHLGCPVRWLPKADLFMCPCHGGVYYFDGQVAAGPPPRPLTRYPVRVRNSRVEIRTSQLPIT
jgi:menaquinol-cytochrome c reductase iron-sulfur subunit